MNNDQNEIDIDNIFDNLEIKPLTKGLGFHHSLQEEKKVEVSLKAKSKSLQKDLELRAKKLNTNSQVTRKTAGSNSINMGELAPFYNTESENELAQEVKLSQEIKKPKSKKKIKVSTEASIGIRFIAWLLDTSVIAVMISFIPVSIVTFSSIDASVFNIFLKSADLIAGSVIFFTMIYHFYFSFFDKTEFGTLGKRVFSLKVVNEKGSCISFGQSFTRCFITIFSIVTLGITSLLKFQDKITETKVVKANV